MRRLRRRVAALGSAAVTLYSAALATQILVWNPTATVPGMPLGDILSAMSAGDNAMPWGSVLAVAGVGVALALGVGVLGVRRRWRPSSLVSAYLAVIGGGAPAYFGAAFAPGTNLADTFGVSGADPTVAGILLPAVSVVAVLGIGGVALRRRRVRRF